ncbi:MAG: ATP synthase subunit I [Bryobacteraceae bacterium]|nr:ATP synthase subunit I [Bryobacteraceae bacterium]MDW8379414.1 ATP synthase subunit I [Bryobacterales bacterium]
MSAANFDFDRTLSRLWRFLWLLTAGGVLVSWLCYGRRIGTSFFAGAVLSALSLRLTHRFVLSIGHPSSPRPAAWKRALLGARWLLLAGVLYVMMKLFGLQIVAALCGMLVAAGATILEILYELIHGREHSGTENPWPNTKSR